MERKSVIGLVLFWVVLAVLLITPVIAQANVFDPVTNLFANWTEGNLSINIAKYVLWGVLILLVYSILAVIPFVKGTESGKVAIRWVLAILVSFLSMAYLTPSDVYTTLASYGAMGIVLGGVIPFVILLFFSIEMSKEGGAGGAMMSNIIWIAFIMFLIYKIVNGMFFCEFNDTSAGALSGNCINYVEGGIYLALILISLIWMWKGKSLFMSAAMKSEIQGQAAEMDKGKRAMLLDQADKLDEQALAVMKMPGGKANAETLRKRAKEMREVAGK